MRGEGEKEPNDHREGKFLGTPGGTNHQCLIQLIYYSGLVFDIYRRVIKSTGMPQRTIYSDVTGRPS